MASPIYIIEDDPEFARCLARACQGYEVYTFTNCIDAISMINDHFPSLIFLDILLTGPDGFTFLNELVSYPDTAKIPVVIASSLDFSGKDLSPYGVVGVLSKDTLTPKDIKTYAKRYSD